MNMRVALHSGTLSDGNAIRGVGAYTKLLFESLKQIEKDNNFSVELVSGAEIDNVNIKDKFDIVHYPFFDFFYHTLAFTSHLPRVVTIHDTIPLIYPKQYPPGIKGSLRYALQKLSIRNTAAVITDSVSSKKDIVRFLPVKEYNVHPIYLGPTVKPVASTNTNILKKYNLPPEYVLYVGDINWNKNVVLLAKACVKLKKHLVIVGKMATSTEYDKEHIENRELRELQSKFGDNEYIHMTGFVPDLDMGHIFKGATLLCQPSHYEGFGLSVLDAMNVGVPTICGRTQALVEIYESASEFFDPKSLDSLVVVLEKILNSKAFQSELAKKGKELAKKFSWEKTAIKTLEVYKSALK